MLRTHSCNQCKQISSPIILVRILFRVGLAQKRFPDVFLIDLCESFSSTENVSFFDLVYELTFQQIDGSFGHVAQFSMLDSLDLHYQVDSWKVQDKIQRICLPCLFEKGVLVHCVFGISADFSLLCCVLDIPFDKKCLEIGFGFILTFVTAITAVDVIW